MNAIPTAADVAERATQQIETAMNAKGFVSDVCVDGKYVDFNINGVGYFGRISRGNFVAGSGRRAPY